MIWALWKQAASSGRKEVVHPLRASVRFGFEIMLEWITIHKAR